MLTYIPLALAGYRRGIQKIVKISMIKLLVTNKLRIFLLVSVALSVDYRVDLAFGLSNSSLLLGV